MAKFEEIRPRVIVEADVWDPKHAPHDAVAPNVDGYGHVFGIIPRLPPPGVNAAYTDVSQRIEVGWVVAEFETPAGSPPYFEGFAPDDFVARFRPLEEDKAPALGSGSSETLRQASKHKGK